MLNDLGAASSVTGISATVFSAATDVISLFSAVVKLFSATVKPVIPSPSLSNSAKAVKSMSSTAIIIVAFATALPKWWCIACGVLLFCLLSFSFMFLFLNLLENNAAVR